MRKQSEFLQRPRPRSLTQAQLDDLELTVTDHDFYQACRTFARSIKGVFDERENEIMFRIRLPSGKEQQFNFKVLYRKFGDRTVAFEIFPTRTLKGGNKSLFWRRFHGPASEDQELFMDFLKWLGVIRKALQSYVNQTFREKILASKIANQWLHLLRGK